MLIGVEAGLSCMFYWLIGFFLNAVLELGLRVIHSSVTGEGDEAVIVVRLSRLERDMCGAGFCAKAVTAANVSMFLVFIFLSTFLMSAVKGIC